MIDLANDKFISGIDVDPDEDKLYMAIENEGAIYRCNLNGTGLETDWRTGINEPNDIALRKPGSVFATRQNTVTIFPPDFFNVALSFPYTVDRIDEDSAVAFAIGSGSIFRISDGPKPNRLSRKHWSPAYRSHPALHTQTVRCFGPIRAAGFSCVPMSAQGRTSMSPRCSPRHRAAN